jgi:hypothetical protein
MHRVGHNHIYTVSIRYLWQGNHQIYIIYGDCGREITKFTSYTVYIYTVLANPTYIHRVYMVPANLGII